MNRQDFFNLCDQHIDHARAKHPVFAKRVLWRSHDLATEYLASMHKKAISDRGNALEDILMSEVHEFLLEVYRGNHTRAIEEAADVVAVLYRAIAGDITHE